MARLEEWVAQGWAVSSSVLRETELRRMAQRWPIAQERGSDLLDRFDLFEPHPRTHRTAGLRVEAPQG